MLKAQSIPSLLNGVSQQPKDRRLPSQLTEQVNALSDPARGLVTRPPTTHKGQISESTAGYSSAFLHSVVRDTLEQYRLAIVGGVAKAFDALTGASVPVYAPSGTSYLTAPGTYRAVTVGDSTILANSGVTVRKAPLKATDSIPGALVFVRSTGPNATFTLTVNGQSVTVTAAASGTTAASTEAVALALLNAIAAAIPYSFYQWHFTTYGSTLHISGPLVSITATDGMGGNGIAVIRDSVQDFSTLPASAPSGFIVEVVGDPDSDKDNYFVSFDGKGVWRECPKPGTLLGFDPETMPHAFIRNGAIVPKATHVRVQDAFVVGSGAYTNVVGGATVSAATTVVFDTGHLYPANGSVTFTFSGDPVPKVVLLPSTDSTAAQVIAAIIAQAPGLGFTAGQAAGDSNIVHISTGSVGSYVAPATVVVVGGPNGGLYDPSLSLVPGALVGMILRNLTDGSAGLITDNTAHTIVATLTGGASNTFSSGDVCEVVAAAAKYFVFAPIAWKQREAGDLTVVPFPSFTDSTIREVFFHQGRLGFLSGENVILSASGDVFNFFRQTATQLLADDVIDIRSALREVTQFHSAVQWNEGLYLFTEQGQYLLSGDPVLTPATVRLDPVTKYANIGACRPVESGNRLYFVRGRSGSAQAWEYTAPQFQSQPPEALDITKHVPTYLDGTPVMLAGDSSMSLIAVRTSTRTGSLYVYVTHSEGDTRVVSSWSRWDFPGATILGMDMVSGFLNLVVQRSDGIFLESVDLTARPDIFEDRIGHSTRAPYALALEFTPMFYRDRNGDADTRGRLVVRSIDILFTDTFGFTATVEAPGRLTKSYPQAFEGATSRRCRIPVQLQNDAATLKITHAGPGGCCFTGLDWEGTYTTRSQR